MIGSANVSITTSRLVTPEATEWVPLTLLAVLALLGLVIWQVYREDKE